MKPLRGMTLQLLQTIMRAGICSVLIFVIIVQGVGVLIGNYFSASELQHQMISHRVEKFMKYVADYDLSATDYTAIQKWCDKQPLVLMEIYRNNYLLFNSNYYDESALSDKNIEVTYYDWYSYYEIPFADGNAEMLIYSDESYVLQSITTLFALSLAGFIFILIVLCDVKKTIRYIYLLTDEIGIMGNGDLEHPISIKGNNELTTLAMGLEKTRQSLVAHRRNEEIMLVQNRNMITGLSHDLRTPLTKIMLCVEVIQGKKYRSEQELNDYLIQTYNNSLQLKAISEHILQYSLSQKGIQELQIRIIGFRETFFDILSETVDYFAGVGLETQCDIEWPTCKIEIIDLNIRRIMDNIVSNIEKYADRAYPVSIVYVEDEDYAGFEFKNKKMTVNSLEGHHVGLENLQSLLSQMGGNYRQMSDDNYFRMTIHFHIMRDDAS